MGTVGGAGVGAGAGMGGEAARSFEEERRAVMAFVRAYRKHIGPLA